MIHARTHTTSAPTFYRPVDQTVVSTRGSQGALFAGPLVLSVSVVLLVVVLLGLISHIPAPGAT